MKIGRLIIQLDYPKVWPCINNEPTKEIELEVHLFMRSVQSFPSESQCLDCYHRKFFEDIDCHFALYVKDTNFCCGIGKTLEEAFKESQIEGKISDFYFSSEEKKDEDQ